MIIYRIQDEEGRGPFKPGFSQYWVQERQDHENLLPWYEEFSDVTFLAGVNYGVGCTSLDKLRRWFTKKEYKKLKKYGYKAVEMDVTYIAEESATQCLFARTSPLIQDIKPVKLY